MLRTTQWGTALLASGVLIAGAVSLTSPAAAEDGTRAASPDQALFEVIIYNLTRNQVFSPPLVVSHNENIGLFEPGMAAGPELAALAENGDNMPFKTLLSASTDVLEYAEAAGPVPPMGMATVTIELSKDFPYLSAAGMLISTNDAFFGLDSMTGMSSQEEFRRYVAAWDSGTEANSEDCQYIPGPPCNAGAVHDPAPAEGFVHIHNGIFGKGGVPADEYDWRNPVAMIIVRRL